MKADGVGPPEDRIHQKMRMSEQKATWTGLVIAAWTVVAIPLTWGVYQTVIKSLPLFRASAAAEAPARPAAHK